MLPICRVPETIQWGLSAYRELFCRQEGFEHVSRYVTGLILSANKTAPARDSRFTGLGGSKAESADDA